MKTPPNQTFQGEKNKERIPESKAQARPTIKTTLYVQCHTVPKLTNVVVENGHGPRSFRRHQRAQSLEVTAETRQQHVKKGNKLGTTFPAVSRIPNGTPKTKQNEAGQTTRTSSAEHHEPVNATSTR